MPRVCFKPITWYIEMHLVRAIFLVWRLYFFVFRDVRSHRVYLQEESLSRFFSAIELSSCALFISWRWNIIRTNSECFFDAKRPVSFLLEDKHVVNEHHVVRKSHDATQKKMPSRGIKNITVKAWVSRSTGKSNNLRNVLVTGLGNLILGYLVCVAV